MIVCLWCQALTPQYVGLWRSHWFVAKMHQDEQCYIYYSMKLLTSKSLSLTLKYPRVFGSSSLAGLWNNFGDQECIPTCKDENSQGLWLMHLLLSLAAWSWLWMLSTCHLQTWLFDEQVNWVDIDNGATSPDDVRHFNSFSAHTRLEYAWLTVWAVAPFFLLLPWIGWTAWGLPPLLVGATANMQMTH